MQFNTIESALEDIKKGKMVIVLDNEDRENEGDLIMSAEMATPEAINFMTTQGRGLICVPMLPERAKQLDLPLMVNNNHSLFETAFTISVDGKFSGTGISAHDRARTISDIVNTDTKPSDLIKPGHIFPLIAKTNGVLERKGHTEAAVDLTRLAGLKPIAVICEILLDDGSMARRDNLLKMAQEMDLKIITIEALIEYRLKHEKLIKNTVKIPFANKYGEFTLHLFQNSINENEYHLALVKGAVNTGDPILVRIHSECFTGDLFGSARCDCGDQLRNAMELLEKKGQGVLLYMKQEGRGIGLANKIKAYYLQDHGHDTVSANEVLGFAPDLRDYNLAAQILKQLGVERIQLLTNNPQKIEALEQHDFVSIVRIPLEIAPTCHNIEYLETKKIKMGHLLENIISTGEGNEYFRRTSKCQTKEIWNSCSTLQ